MHASEEIIVLFAKHGCGEYPDPVNDVVVHSLNGFFTWRSQRQADVNLPEAMHIAFSFNHEDTKQDHSAAFIERIVDFSAGCLSFHEARDISAKFNRDVTEATFQHGRAHYVHSATYVDIIKLIEREGLSDVALEELRSGIF